MCDTRSTFLEILHAHSQQDIAKFRESNKCLQKRADRSRIFDDFPDLLPKPILSKLTLQLVTCLKNIKSVKVTNDKITLSESDQCAIKKILEVIADYGCRDLLNQHNCIHHDVRQFLGWDKTLDEQASQDIVLAYISANIQSIIATEEFQQASNNIAQSHLNGAVLFMNQYYEIAMKKMIGEHKPSLTKQYGIPIGGMLYFTPTPSHTNDPAECGINFKL